MVQTLIKVLNIFFLYSKSIKNTRYVNFYLAYSNMTLHELVILRALLSNTKLNTFKTYKV